MPSILSTVLFASAVAAQMTTSIWLPAFDDNDTTSYQIQASVVGAKGDQVTFALELEDEENNRATQEIFTYYGTTSLESIVTTSDPSGDYKGDFTVRNGCSVSGNRPVCTTSMNGPAAWSAYCEGYSDVVTSTDLVPDFCLSGSLLPESIAVSVVTGMTASIKNYAITVTAGEEKLSATAGATPTNTGPSATTTGNATPTSSPSNGNSTVPTSSPTAPAQQTGAAAPLVTLAPALAGLGAVVAALL